MIKILKFIFISFIVLSINYDSKNHIDIYYIPIGELCLIKNTTGFPCPGCGMTRAHIEAMKLNFKKAFYYHPLFILPSIIFSIVLFRKKIKIADYLYNNSAVMLITLFIFIAVYVIRFILFFPDKEPFTYNYDNIFYSTYKIIIGIIK